MFLKTVLEFVYCDTIDYFFGRLFHLSVTLRVKYAVHGGGSVLWVDKLQVVFSFGWVPQRVVRCQLEELE